MKKGRTGERRKGERKEGRERRRYRKKEEGWKDKGGEGENTKNTFGNQFANTDEINNFIEKYSLLKLLPE